ncbi:hypothetical protein DSECCO2_120310 [anaerobic digester metagenome]
MTTTTETKTTALDITVKKRAQQKGEAALLDAIQVAKTTDKTITDFGIRIKRAMNLLILF